MSLRLQHSIHYSTVLGREHNTFDFFGAQKKSLVEKMTVERKPGGRKAWCVLKNTEKKPGVFFFCTHD